MNLTFGLSVASLVFGLLILLFTVLALDTPITDIGMLSTAGVFVLFGVFGLLLDRAQADAAARQ